MTLIAVLVLAGCQQQTDTIVTATMNRAGGCTSIVSSGANTPWQDPARGFSVREEHTPEADRCVIERVKVR